MNLDNAKNRFDQQFVKAIHSKSGDIRLHPIRVIQAVKSLFGINTDKISEKLLDWGDLYLDDYTCYPKDRFMYKIDKPKETVVISKLGKYICSKDKNSCKKELQDLCLVSDGSQIFEYLLEFAALNNADSVLFIWSAYRTNLFLKNKYSYSLLSISVDKLIDELNEKRSLMYDFDCICVFESIKNNPLTRKDRILKAFGVVDFKSPFFEESYSEKTISISEKGRLGILDYINKLSLEDISPNLILFLDSCRMVLKDSAESNHLKIENSLNYVIEQGIYD